MRVLRGVVLVPIVVAATVCCFSAAAGNYSPPGGDGQPQWLSNSVIAFNGVDPQTGFWDGVRTVDVDASPPVGRPIRPLGARAAGGLVSPNGQLLALQLDTPDRPLVVTAPDGSQQRILFKNASAIGWVADSSRLIFQASGNDGAITGLYSVRPDGSGLTEYPANVRGAPSPDGSRFAYVVENDEPSRIHIVTADGARTTMIASRSSGDSSPVWSPDGRRLAFLSNGALPHLAVAEIGGGVRVLDITAPGLGSPIVWWPGGRVVYASTDLGLLGIDLATGSRRLLRGLRNPVFSPDGSRIAYTAGGECRDRVGIYVANADGSSARRVSNSCRVVGTDGPDILSGTFSQVVLGLGGNDTLYAADTGYFFQGITLLGGPGNDQLYGDYAQDTLDGGPGDDSLSGGPSKDILVGGAGYDRIDGGGGGDTIGAQDGERDRITCGRNGYGRDGRDIVYADRADIVARDCEIVHRR